ncbi:acetoacetate--CoA ligase [Fodinisporobacter ferrooxydans]|uniref:Acetoacetate--CoA ligase n=1 Tax=Fodinisporobacter ferrooxydans TaxID=2901836 RepID=A0ABY4CH92_9BACL|nr:acetoacetate--CoA ligase [Alicyclobacillaceae bacterium MYW30-H2]
MAEGTILWEPSIAQIEKSRVYHYMRWVQNEYALTFSGYEALWQWSVDHMEDFWESLWSYFQIIQHSPYQRVLQGDAMPGIRWFEGAALNYAEHVFRNEQKERPAILFQSEHQSLKEITWETLHHSVASVAKTLRNMGVQAGDRVVSYMPNIPQTVIAFLACASIGAVWSSCSPDFGTPSVIDRFQQIEPKVLFTIDGYQYNGKSFDKMNAVAELQHALPTLQHTILVPYLKEDISADLPENTILWEEVLQTAAKLQFEPLAFDHPLWVLYSSGTTGLPKAIVQGHGGILLEHLKTLSFHSDISANDRFFWYTTTGWMMWNYLISGLLVGATVLLYDGNPAYPDMHVLWKFAESTKMTVFGTSASYITSCIKAGIQPGKTYDLSALRGIGSTGSPLTPEGFKWVYDKVKPDIWLAPLSGGTDVCSAFVGGCPVLPVRVGEMQCRFLGSKVEAYDPAGQSLIDEMGELVLSKPMPSMPLYFWNDPDGKRYRESYFDVYPGIWRHGDWMQIGKHGGCVIYGRSDSTINRHGIRMGTRDIYQAVESIEEVVDSLVVDLELLGRPSFLPLFVVLRPGVQLDDSLRQKIKAKIRETVSPRHVPDEIFAVNDIPKTLNGKKLEVPIRRILLGHPVAQAVNLDSMGNPQSLTFFIDLAKQLNKAGQSMEWE